jgi:hypothetical protein
MGGEVKAGEFDVWGPQNISPLVAWLSSDDAAGCNGQVFRVGGRTVWPMKGWHSAAKVQNPKQEIWDAAGLTEPAGQAQETSPRLEAIKN